MADVDPLATQRDLTADIPRNPARRDLTASRRSGTAASASFTTALSPC